MSTTHDPHTDSRARFTATVDLYERYRPGYPSALVGLLVDRGAVPAGGKILDVGCGTGISSRLFAASGFNVVGIDPNDAMLSRATATGGGPTYAKGECTATRMGDASFDLAIAGQAFHWFPIEPTLIELLRVLKSGAPFAAFWNVRAETPAMLAYERLLLDSSSDYASVATHADTIDRIVASPALARHERHRLENEQRLDREGFHGRAWSSSYVVHGVADRDGFNAGLDTIFDRYGADGGITFAYDVEIAIGWL